MNIKSLAACAVTALLFLYPAQTAHSHSTQAPRLTLAPRPARVAELYQMTEKVRSLEKAACLQRVSDPDDCYGMMIPCGRPSQPYYEGKFADDEFTLIVDNDHGTATYTDAGHDGIIAANQDAYALAVDEYIACIRQIEHPSRKL